MKIIENENAQFMLLAGFIIAIGLVITTALLSNVIFQSNMAGEAGSDPSKYEIVNMMAITADEMKSAYRDANSSGGTNAQKINNFTNQTRNFNANLSRIYALHGGGVNASWDVSNWNSSRYANFTKNGTASGTKNWTVIENVQNAYVFNLTNVCCTGSNFMVNVSDQTTGTFLWSMQLKGGNPKNITITKNISAYPNPPQPSKQFTVNYTNINLLESFPPNYEFYANVAGHIYKIEFLNGDDAYGGYIILGNTSYGRNFTRARDYILNATVTFSTSKMRANITFPVSVPW